MRHLTKDFSVRRSKLIMKTFHSTLHTSTVVFQVIHNSQTMMKISNQSIRTSKARNLLQLIQRLELTVPT